MYWYPIAGKVLEMSPPQLHLSFNSWNLPASIAPALARLGILRIILQNEVFQAEVIKEREIWICNKNGVAYSQVTSIGTLPLFLQIQFPWFQLSMVNGGLKSHTRKSALWPLSCHIYVKYWVCYCPQFQTPAVSLGRYYLRIPRDFCTGDKISQETS